MSELAELINADFSRKVSVNINEMTWIDSPASGVKRKPLDRVGGEVARATTVVQFKAGHSFPHHEHGGGEEFLVLSGVFSDETGDYGPMSYVRNPPGTGHKPYSADGCEIFVKLCQMKPSGEPQMVVDSEAMVFTPVEGASGLFRKALFDGASLHETLPESWNEVVAIEKRVPMSGVLPELFEHGAEVLVLSGVLYDGDEPYGAMNWVRFPVGSMAHFSVREETCYWIKRGIDFP